MNDYYVCLSNYVNLFYTNQIYIKEGYCSPGGGLSFQKSNKNSVPIKINGLFVIVKYSLWVFLILVIALMIFILLEYFRKKSG